MIDLKDFKPLFQFLKIKNYLKKHWLNSTNQTMLKIMHNIILGVIKVVVHNAQFISVSQSRLVVYACICDLWMEKDTNFIELAIGC